MDINIRGFISYREVISHLRRKEVSSDKYVRLMARIVAASIYGNGGDLPWSRSTDMKYDASSIITDITARNIDNADPLPKAFLAYTVMRIVDPTGEWNLWLTKSGMPFLMSKENVAIQNAENSQWWLLIGTDDKPLTPICKISDLDRDISNYHRHISHPNKDQFIPVYINRSINKLGNGDMELRRLAYEMMKSGSNIANLSKGYPIWQIHNIRYYSIAYRALKAYDIILTRIPPPICRDTVLPPIPRNNEQFRPDIDILTYD